MTRRYAGSMRTEEGIERHRAARRQRDARNNKVARQVQMHVGGRTISIGYAPTAEAAAHLRRKIREEAPNARTDS